TVTAEERLHHTPVVPPAPSGSQELARAVAAAGATAPADTQVMLLARPGIIAWGASVQQACAVADLAEYTARTAIADASPPSGRAAIDAAALEGVALRHGDILLCLTDNSWRWEKPEFQRDFTHLPEDAAQLLVARGVRAVGMDYLSIDRFGSEGFPVHHRLLAAGVFVLEGLDLRAVEAGRYTHVLLALKFPELDGAPARAVLLA